MTMAYAAAATAASTIGGALISADAQKKAAASAERAAAAGSTTRTDAPDYIKGQYERLASDIGQIRDRGLLEDIQRLSDYERGLVQQGMTQWHGVMHGLLMRGALI